MEIRDPAERKRDLLLRLEHEKDIWVATAAPDGVPCLVPLWFHWDGEFIWFVTRFTNPTGRNLRANGRARLSLPDTRDVILIDGEVTSYTREEVPPEAADAFTADTGWDPREDAPSYGYFRVRLVGVQAWREVQEMRGRELMREGAWLTD